MHTNTVPEFRQLRYYPEAYDAAPYKILEPEAYPSASEILKYGPLVELACI
jgi:hypothetical protein